VDRRVVVDDENAGEGTESLHREKGKGRAELAFVGPLF
jgi:hypothetical protein